MAMSEGSLTKDYCFFPILNPTLFKIYKEQQDAIWSASEIDFTSDRKEWYNLDEKSKQFLKQILGFFSCADGIVNENIIENFKKDTKHIKEAGFFYSLQNYIETVHAETYALFIETFMIDTDPEKEKLFRSIETMPFVTKIARWMFKWMERNVDLLSRIIAFACVEGIFFCGAFAAIYWIKQRNILPGLTKANEWIARDEGLHVQFAIELYKVILKSSVTLTEERVHNIIKDAIEVSEEFIRNSLQIDLIGLDAERMIEYTKTIADKLCIEFGYKKIYNCEHKLDWMMSIGLNNKSNFFETKVSEYKKLSKSDINVKDFGNVDF